MKYPRFKINHDTVHPYVDEAILEITENRAEISPVQAQIAHCAASGFVNTILLVIAENGNLDTDMLHELCKIQNLITIQTYKNWTFDHDRPEADSQIDAPAKARWYTLPLRWLRNLIP